MKSKPSIDKTTAIILGVRAAYAGHELKPGFNLAAETYPHLRNGFGPINFALGYHRGVADKAAGHSLADCESEVTK